jgi:predicted PurR-regulated permease PerM
MTIKRLQVISFLVLILLVLILAMLLIRPFFEIVALGFIFAVLLHPFYSWLKSRIGSRGLAAGLTLLLFAVVVIVPLSFLFQMAWGELLDFYHRLTSNGFIFSTQELFSRVPQSLQPLALRLNTDLTSWLAQLSSHLFAGVSGLLSNIAKFVFSVFLLFFVTYYFLRDGQTIRSVLLDLSPLATSQEHELFGRLIAAVNGVVKGSFFTALIQGIVATAGFFIFGIPNPLLWGAFTVLVALVPTVGTSLAIIPAVLYLFLTNHVGASVGMLIWGALAVGLIDNIIGPKLVGSTTKVHPLLVFLGVLGGLQLFGFAGFLLGPILMAVLVALIDIYRKDFKDYFQATS